jgi:hypothetical protein
MDVPNRIRHAAERLRQGHRVYRMTVRDFLGHFGAERRGAVKVEEIQTILDSLGLETDPNFQSAWIDEPIQVRLKSNVSTETGMLVPTEMPGDDGEEIDEIILDGTRSAVTVALEQAKAAPTSEEPSALEPPARGAGSDPTFRIGSLPARSPISR